MSVTKEQTAVEFMLEGIINLTVLGYTSVVVKKYRKFKFKTDFTDTKPNIN